MELRCGARREPAVHGRFALLSPAKLVERASIESGFSGIYIDRRGYEAGGQELVRAMLRKIPQEPITSRDGSLLLFRLPAGDGVGNKAAANTDVDSCEAFQQGRGSTDGRQPPRTLTMRSPAEDASSRLLIRPRVGSAGAFALLMGPKDLRRAPIWA